MALVIPANSNASTDNHNQANTVLAIQAEYPAARAGGMRGLVARAAKVSVEAVFGLTMGAAAGHVGGWWVGRLYVQIFRPACATDLAEITRWWTMPCTFAQIGTFIGATLGLLLVALIVSYLTTERIATMYNRGTQNHRELARMLGLREAKVQQVLSHLAFAGRIEHD